MAQGRSLFSALPKFRRGPFILFAVALVLTAVLADQPLGEQLLLTPTGIWRGEGLWQPITANFIAPDGNVGLLIGTAVVQWFFAGALDEFWGTRKYLTLVIGCGIAGHVVAAAVAGAFPEVGSVALGGPTAMDLAAVVGFGVVFGKRPLHLLGLLPLSSRGLAAIVAAVAVLSPLARGAPWPVVVPWLVSMLGALAITTQPWRHLRSSGKLGGSKRKSKGRSHLRVVRSDRDLPN